MIWPLMTFTVYLAVSTPKKPIPMMPFAPLERDVLLTVVSD
ncbi:Uncharacterised protein [Vibrio cholerae]|nr:Uncharacterised protein [Vibrio cholerae]